MASFLSIHPESHFSLQNLPYGVFRPGVGAPPRPGVAIGEFVLDLRAVAEAGLFSGPLLHGSDCFNQSSLNAFMALGRPAWKEARATIQKLLSADEPALRDDVALRDKLLFPMAEVQMELPAAIGDYTDFFSSRYHASNCGKIFRGVDALPDNWLHVPIAYHGRASSVIPSGHQVIRPRGQVTAGNKNSLSEFGPSRLLDFELEMAFFVGPGNDLGTPIPVEEAYDHIFGMVLMNDWSARDIQKWESMPLGPFLGKSFATTISPWIVTMEALEPFLCEAPSQDFLPLPYLREPERKTYNIDLEVFITPEGKTKSSTVCRTNFKYLYWTIEQQLAHHTINGCNLRPGDLLASGTISGPEKPSFGCLLEQSWGGRQEVALEHGGTRKFLEDGDEVTITGWCKGNGFSVGFGACTGKVQPARV